MRRDLRGAVESHRRVTLSNDECIILQQPLKHWSDLVSHLLLYMCIAIHFEIHLSVKSEEGVYYEEYLDVRTLLGWWCWVREKKRLFDLKLFELASWRCVLLFAASSAIWAARFELRFFNSVLTQLFVKRARLFTVSAAHPMLFAFSRPKIFEFFARISPRSLRERAGCVALS